MGIAVREAIAKRRVVKVRDRKRHIKIEKERKRENIRKFREKFCLPVM